LDSQGDLIVNDANGCVSTVFNNFGTCANRRSLDNSTQFQSGVVLNNQGALDIEAGVLFIAIRWALSARQHDERQRSDPVGRRRFNINGTITSTNVQLIGGSLAGNNLLPAVLPGFPVASTAPA